MTSSARRWLERFELSLLKTKPGTVDLPELATMPEVDGVNYSLSQATINGETPLIDGWIAEASESVRALEHRRQRVIDSGDRDELVRADAELSQAEFELGQLAAHRDVAHHIGTLLAEVSRLEMELQSIEYGTTQYAETVDKLRSTRVKIAIERSKIAGTERGLAVTESKEADARR